MKIVDYEFPHSSFLAVEKDLSIITTKFLENNRLKKLLYYTTQDALSQPNLTDAQSHSLLNKQIKIVPKLQIDNEVLIYIIISFDNFVPNESNPEFRDNLVTFDIICHFNQWQLKDFQLRPYKIAAEIDSMIASKKLTGIGTLQYMGTTRILLNDEFAGLHLVYGAIHGGEDHKNMLNPNDWLQFKQDFDQDFNVSE